MPRDNPDRANAAAVAYFDTHADYYDRNQYQTQRRTFMNGRHDTIVAVVQELSLPADAKVLDAGCGPGNLVLEFAKRRWQVFALDASPKMLQVARSHTDAAKYANVCFNVGSITSLPFADASFDLVCSAGVIEYLNPADPAMEEFRRVLKPGGVLLLPTTNVLAPAHWLRPVLEPISRMSFVARAFGIERGRYRVWFSFIPRFRQRLHAAGLDLQSERYFYLTLPRPLDRMFPRATRRLERWFDRRMTTVIRHLAEGYLAVAVRRNGDRATGKLSRRREL